MKIVATAELPAVAGEILRDHELVEHEWRPGRSRDELAALLAGADAVIAMLGDRFDDELLGQLPSLRIVSNFAVGYDNVDLEAAAKRGIWVTNTPGVLTDATADFTMTLLLALTRRLIEADRIMREDRYEGWHPLHHLGSGLQGKTLGVFGMGRIGGAVAKRATAFGMDVIYSSRSGKDLPYRRVSFDALLSESDVVSIHAPLSADTRHAFDRDTFRSMKRGSFLINTARGAIVDENALVEALEAGELAGAGLDVFENEPHAHAGLRERDDVVLAPHIGSATIETRSQMARLAAENVAAALRGERPPHPVECGAERRFVPSDKSDQSDMSDL